MQRESFAPDQRRHVVRAERGYLAFVPPPLPPSITVDAALLRLLSRADRALGQLAGAAAALPSAVLLAGTLLRREAVLSSQIEGTQASLSDLVLFEAVNPPDDPHSASAGSADVQEVANYVAAMRHVLDPKRRLPLSVSLLREAHAILMSGARGGYATPGEVRRTQNWIGPAGSTLNDATYVPPPPELLWQCLDAFEKHLYAEHDLPPLITIGTLHYQFEAIHPFLDGNGRLGRLLVALLFVEWDLLGGPFLDLSAWIEPRRSDYYARLLATSTDGDWSGWVRFFLTGVGEQASDAIARARALGRLRDDYRGRVATARSSGLLGALVDALFEVPALTIGRASSLLGVTHRSSTLNIEKLVAADILVELDTVGRRRVFLAREILETIEGRRAGEGPPPDGSPSADESVAADGYPEQAVAGPVPAP